MCLFSSTLAWDICVFKVEIKLNATVRSKYKCRSTKIVGTGHDIRHSKNKRMHHITIHKIFMLFVLWPHVHTVFAKKKQQQNSNNNSAQGEREKRTFSSNENARPLRNQSNWANKVRWKAPKHKHTSNNSKKQQRQNGVFECNLVPLRSDNGMSFGWSPHRKHGQRCIGFIILIRNAEIHTWWNEISECLAAIKA